MTQNEINKLLAKRPCGSIDYTPQLIETHISWVILCDQTVFKIKKPIQYSFLNFSTIEKRKFYCERELSLNRRLAPIMYLDVVPVFPDQIDGMPMDSGDPIIDYAVKMQRMDNQRQMDVLLKAGKVASNDIQRLAATIAKFHKHCSVIDAQDVLSIQKKFNDLQLEGYFLNNELGSWSKELIEESIILSDNFLQKNSTVLQQRLKDGMFRDGHGDLHSRNIFLMPEPIIFDCIEFNDEYREIDVLNELAFLCMDLDAWGEKNLSNQLIEDYLRHVQIKLSEQERNLFLYYKSYRANVRAKVNSLRAKDLGGVRKTDTLSECQRYLHLMRSYLLQI